MSFTTSDSVALKAALFPSGAVIRELATVPVSTAGATIRLKGTYQIQSASTDSFTMSFQDVGTADPATLGVVITLPAAGYTSGTPGVATGAGVSISGTPFYEKNGTTTLQSFNIVVVLPAGSGGWSLVIDPSTATTAAGAAGPIVFSHIEFDRTA